jgi:preprotein translocase subunit YajC
LEINDNQQAQDEATGIRQKENAAYMAEKTEMETTLNALQRGIEVMSGAGTKTALLQTAPTDEMTLLSSIIRRQRRQHHTTQHLLPSWAS